MSLGGPGAAILVFRASTSLQAARSASAERSTKTETAMKITIYPLCLLVVASTLASSARADLDSYFVRSLEWLTDSSDVIVIVEVTQSANKMVAKTQTIIKAPAQARLQDLPHGELNKLVADLPPGRQVLVFGRLGKGGTLRVVDGICLREVTHPPLRGDALEAARYLAVTGSLKDKAKESVCAALTKHGTLLVKIEHVLSLVQQRIAQGSLVPADCDRERVERPYSDDDYGGVFHSPGTPFDSNTAIYHVLVPWEPEYEKALHEELRSGNGSSKVVAARQLANYRSPESIAALKTCLHDTFVRLEEENGSQVPVYAVRAAAFQSLRRLKVDVPEPNLRPFRPWWFFCW
jgi:hypothetical protein